jgi:hypothetical protein
MVHFVTCLFNFYRVLSRSELLGNFLNWGESDTLQLSTTTLAFMQKLTSPQLGLLFKTIGITQ